LGSKPPAGETAETPTKAGVESAHEGRKGDVR
jgi:hypothetical protein